MASKQFVIQLVLFSGMVAAGEQQAMQQQIDDLLKRVIDLEYQVSQLSGENNWKDPVYWQKLKKEMHETDVEKILGKPARKEEKIFTTWYYHPTSKLHSFVWFDEGMVLGWEFPQ